MITDVAKFPNSSQVSWIALRTMNRPGEENTSLVVSFGKQVYRYKNTSAAGVDLQPQKHFDAMVILKKTGGSVGSYMNKVKNTPAFCDFEREGEFENFEDFHFRIYGHQWFDRPNQSNQKQVLVPTRDWKGRYLIGW